MQDGYDASLSNTLAAVYATERDAREAIKDLHKAGFKQTWLGMTQPADSMTGAAMVEETGGLGRFISAGDRMPLHKALLRHGISETQAERIEDDIAPGCAIVTAYGEDNPAKAREILTVRKGQVVGGTTEVPEAVRRASAEPRTGVPKDERKGAERMRSRDALDDEDRDVVTYRDDYSDYPGETFFERGRSGGMQMR